MLQILQALHQGGWDIHFASTAEHSEFEAPLNPLDIQQYRIQVNDSAFDSFISELNPDMVIFEHFSMEEQFGWRVEQQCPEAMRVLHTVDLHFLRMARQQAFKSNQPIDLHNSTALREIAAIYRCDLSLIISEAEIRLLREHFNIPSKLLHYTPFMFEPSDIPTSSPTFSERAHFISIGNFRHPPNMDAVQWLHQSIWPIIYRALPEAELHIYGSYAPPKVKALHQPGQGFFMCDRADDALQVMQQARICLAPLRFGAGLKGKLADAMLAGTPSITTEMGAEGMASDLPWNGTVIADSMEFSTGNMETLAKAIAESAIQLYQDQNRWEQAQVHGYQLLRQRFHASDHQHQLIQQFNTIYKRLKSHRHANFIGQMLRHHHHRSTEFMSRWIEEKNKHV